MAKDAKDTKDMLPKEVATAVDLFANPVAGAAALSALGIGLTGQAFGVWVGAMTGAAGVSKQFFDPAQAQSSKPAMPKAAVKIAKKSNGATTSRTKAVRKPVAAEMTDTVQDLKAISGIGPKLEQVLNGLGIRSYGQIAEWTTDDIDAMEAALGFNGRIVRDDWIGQAASLAGTKH